MALDERTPECASHPLVRPDLPLSSREASRRRPANGPSLSDALPRRPSSLHVLPGRGDIRSIELHGVSIDSSRRSVEEPILSTDLPILSEALQVRPCRVPRLSDARLGVSVALPRLSDARPRLSVARASVSDDLPILPEGHPRVPNALSGGSLEPPRFFIGKSTDRPQLPCPSFVTERAWRAWVVVDVRPKGVVFAPSVGLPVHRCKRRRRRGRGRLRGR